MPQQTIQPLLMTVEEAARQLGINRPWLYDAIQWKGCPCYRFGKTMIRVKLSEVQEWLDQRGKENKSDTTASTH